MGKASERADPEDSQWRNTPAYEAIVERTYFARAFCPGARVLDAPCGVGWTTAQLAARAQYVLGIDYSAQAIQVARARYAAQNVEFMVMDCLKMHSLGKGSFDVVCSLEGLEHFDRRDGLCYLDQIRHVLQPGGALVGTTPSAPHRKAACERLSHEQNPFHKHIWAEDELGAALRSRFGCHWVCPMPGGYFYFWARSRLPIKRRLSAMCPDRLRSLLRNLRRRVGGAGAKER